MKIGKFICLLFLSGFSSGIDISAALDQAQISIADQAVLRVTVAGAGGGLPTPQMPGLADFQVANAGRAQSFSWVNGQASASVTYTFVLTPLKEGVFTIPPIRAQEGNEIKETAPLRLEVIKGDAAAISAPSPLPQGEGRSSRGEGGAQRGPAAIFIKGSVDKASVYVGEPVTYTFRLYNRVPLFSRPNYQPPSTQGFWSEDLPPQRTFQTTVEGLPYNVTELKTALFPSAPGTARIGPAQLAVTIENLGSDPFSANFFSSFFGRAEEKVLRTESLTVQVRALPEPKPAGFSGAVGQYTMKAVLDKDAVDVGQTVTLTVTVSGQGSIKSLPALALPSLVNFRTFEPVTAINIEKKAGLVQGSKVYKFILIPTAAGTLSIPSISLSYFDPAARAYKSLQSRTFTLRVQPGSGSPSAGMPSGSGGLSGSAPTPQIQRLAEDIHYIKTAIPAHSQKHWVSQAWFWLLHGLGLFLLLGFGSWRLYQTYVLSASPRLRFKNARLMAEKKIKDAEAALAKNDLKAASGHLGEGLHRYMADKLTLPLAGLSLKQAIETAKDRGLHVHDAEKIRNLWEMLDLFTFAPAQARVDDVTRTLDTFRHVVQEMEKEIQWKK